MPRSRETAPTSAMAVGTVAERAGLAPSAVRYYERIGLIEAPPRVGGRRRYPPAVLDRLALIAMARDAGFTLTEVGELLQGFPRSATPADRWRPLVDRKLVEIDALIERAQAARTLLRHVATCTCPDLEVCGREIVRHRGRSRSTKRAPAEAGPGV